MARNDAKEHSTKNVGHKDKGNSRDSWPFSLAPYWLLGDCCVLPFGSQNPSRVDPGAEPMEHQRDTNKDCTWKVEADLEELSGSGLEVKE